MNQLIKKALQAVLSEIGEAMPKEPMSVTDYAVQVLKGLGKSNRQPSQAYTPPKGVIPKGESTKLAMDYAGGSPVFNALEYATEYNVAMGFPGYAVLAELAQISEYRSPVETIAKEMTRKWGVFKTTGEDDRTDIIKALNDEFMRLNVKEVCRKLIEHDGFYGRGQLYFDIGQDFDNDQPLAISNKTIKQGSLKRLVNVEPMWTAANQYNADNPLNKNFYKPSSWFLFGKTIHDDRLITVISRPVPDMLKPVYNFGGISLTQLLVPYVDNWLGARQATNDLLKAFSTSGIKTDMGTALAGGSVANAVNRAEMFNEFRNNFGTLLLDNKEEFFQFNTPLSTIDKLQAQAQEQMAAPTHIPLVKLFGITPSGLNASSEGEIQVWYDHVRSEQENILDKPVHKIMQLVMLSLFGEIYDDIIFEWNPIEEENEADVATNNKTKAETGATLIEAGVISAEEERKRIATDPTSGYNGLDVDDVPDQPMQDMMDDDDGNEEETADPQSDSTEPGRGSGLS